jgi:hypothetical protein
MHLPSHRILTLDQITPPDLGGHHREPNLDKLAVVLGAQRFRFGNNIRFFQKPALKMFNRYIGTMIDTPAGSKLNPPTISIKPSDAAPRTITVKLHPGRDLKIGHAFREHGNAQAIANLSTPAVLGGGEPFSVEIDILDDFTAVLKQTPESKKHGVTLVQWTPISDDLTADNFHDTGEIDEEPNGFIREKIRHSQDRWLVSLLDQ